MFKFLTSLGFQLKKYPPHDFVGSFKNENGLEINVRMIHPVIRMDFSCHQMDRTLLDNSTIDTVQDLQFILSRNVYLKNNFPKLYQKISEYPTPDA